MSRNLHGQTQTPQALPDLQFSQASLHADVLKGHGFIRADIRRKIDPGFSR
jgi:hypothetical protein